MPSLWFVKSAEDKSASQIEPQVRNRLLLERNRVKRHKIGTIDHPRDFRFAIKPLGPGYQRRSGKPNTAQWR
jgi:hypothetical protein